MFGIKSSERPYSSSINAFKSKDNNILSNFARWTTRWKLFKQAILRVFFSNQENRGERQVGGGYPSRALGLSGALFLAIFLWSWTASCAPIQLAISGSTTVQQRILNPSAEFILAHLNIQIEIRGSNSGRGFEELRSGIVPVAASSSSLEILLEKAGLTDDGTFQEHIIQQDEIVPITHPDNPVEALTWEQLAAINIGQVSNWREVGGPDRKITVITAHPASGTRRAFQKIVMGDRPFVNDHREVLYPRRIIQFVRFFQGGIGSVSKSFLPLDASPLVKVIQTKEISRPLSLITKGPPTREVTAILDLLRTPEAKELFR